MPRGEWGGVQCLSQRPTPFSAPAISTATQAISCGLKSFSCSGGLPEKFSLGLIYLIRYFHVADLQTV